MEKLVTKSIGYFSLTKERFYCSDSSQLKFIQMPGPQAFPLNLNATEDTQNGKRLTYFYDDYLDHILDYIFHHEDTFFQRNSDAGNDVNADVVCQMQVLQTIMCTPYNGSMNWRILASKYKNTIYLCLENPGEESTRDEEQQANDTMETVLKQLVYSDYLNSKSNTHPKGSSEFLYVFRAKLADLTIIYSSPMGGALPNNNRIAHDSISNLTFIECKLGKEKKHADPRLLPTYYGPKEALLWWSECYLKNVDNIYVACTKPSGHVESLKIRTRENLCMENTRVWSPKLCQQFLNQLLHMIQRVMWCVDDASTIYEFNYLAEKRTIYLDQNAGSHRPSFIPDWYRLMVEDNE
ncbi:hypothetical protein KR009_007923 [Drosophila setifemur]|nr:hypothetical protein KR009_007923 [Drosophila setifemur]